MSSTQSVDFKLVLVAAGHPLRVSIGDRGERFVASVRWGAIATSGLGATAREALVAGLAPLGAPMTAAVLASPAMFGASLQLLSAKALG
jgi:hypothetical protein